MTVDDIVALRKVVLDMRFIQAASVVATGQSETKPVRAYMANLTRLDALLEEEYNKARGAKSV